jgi:hypothetical protein
MCDICTGTFGLPSGEAMGEDKREMTSPRSLELVVLQNKPFLESNE